MTFDEWWDRSLALDAELESIANDDSIRPEPDRAQIDFWCIDAHQRVWAEGVG